MEIFGNPTDCMKILRKCNEFVTKKMNPQGAHEDTQAAHEELLRGCKEF